GRDGGAGGAPSDRSLNHPFEQGRLAAESPIDGLHGHSRRRRDVVDRGACVAACQEEAQRGFEDVLASLGRLRLTPGRVVAAGWLDMAAIRWNAHNSNTVSFSLILRGAVGRREASWPEGRGGSDVRGGGSRERRS